MIIKPLTFSERAMIYIKSTEFAITLVVLIAVIVPLIVLFFLIRKKKIVPKKISRTKSVLVYMFTLLLSIFLATIFSFYITFYSSKLLFALKQNVTPNVTILWVYLDSLAFILFICFLGFFYYFFRKFILAIKWKWMVTGAIVIGIIIYVLRVNAVVYTNCNFRYGTMLNFKVLYTSVFVYDQSCQRPKAPVPVPQ